VKGMDNYVKFAKEVHKRNNEKLIGICVGEVIGYTPLTIRIYYNGIPLDFTEFFNFEGLLNDNSGMTSGEWFVQEYPVKIGDKFICMTGMDNQSLYVLGKFESIKDLFIYLLEKS